MCFCITDSLCSIAENSVPKHCSSRSQLQGDHFSMDCGGGGFGIIQMHYIDCVLYFYYSYISFTSDHQALYPRG